jgi:hypothetical protein
LSKVLESFVGKWILSEIENKLDKRQYGALKGKSTTHELVDILHHWHTALDNHESVRIVFIDYAKAFDHVDHSIIVKKLHNLGISKVLIRWVCSFLYDRKQRVKLSEIFSDWLSLKGSMPQGSFLGPLTFLILIDDLTASCLVHKFVDDTTLSEIISRYGRSHMDNYVSEVLDWSSNNLMNVNWSKTKEMLLGNLSVNSTADLNVGGNVIQRIHAFKLLGVFVDDKLNWNCHVNTICKKASSRLYFLKLLKRSSVSECDLLLFYFSVIRSVLEYACPAWHNSLTVAQTNHIETIQKRALCIIYGGASYVELCTKLQLPTLCCRREALCKSFFNSVLKKDSCLNYLLPNPRNTEIADKLRRTVEYIPGTTRTVKCQRSFINFALNNYQTVKTNNIMLSN